MVDATVVELATLDVVGAAVVATVELGAVELLLPLEMLVVILPVSM